MCIYVFVSVEIISLGKALLHVRYQAINWKNADFLLKLKEQTWNFDLFVQPQWGNGI